MIIMCWLYGHMKGIYKDTELKLTQYNDIWLQLNYKPTNRNICYGFTYVTFFWKFLFEGKLFQKEKMGIFLEIFKILKILKIRDSSFVAILILRHFI